MAAFELGYIRPHQSGELARRVDATQCDGTPLVRHPPLC